MCFGFLTTFARFQTSAVKYKGLRSSGLLRSEQSKVLSVPSLRVKILDAWRWDQKVSEKSVLRFVAVTFLILRRIQRDMIRKCVLVIMQSTRYSWQILMKLEYFRQIFEIYSNVKFHENTSSKGRVRTDRQPYVTNLIVAFRNSANVSKSLLRSIWR